MLAQNPTSLAPSVHSTVWSVGPDIPLAGVRTGSDIVGDSIVRLSFTMATLGLAAGLALILGAVGLYGVLSYSVARRRQEIAVHMALGAEQREVMGMVVGWQGCFCPWPCSRRTCRRGVRRRWTRWSP